MLLPLADVVDAIAQKCRADTPHVFGSAAERAAWRGARYFGNASKARKGAESKAAAGILADVPVGLPALTRAVKSSRARKRRLRPGPSRREVLDKFKEEF
mgnify:CR=1 FL=1